MYEFILSNSQFRIFAFELVITVLSIWLFIKLAHKIQFVSNPNPIVKTHTEPVALGGGIVILIIISLTSLYYFYSGESKGLIPIMLIPVLIFGLIDDIYRVKPIIKLIGQIIVAVLYITITNHQLAYIPVIIIFIIASQNAWNLLDIMDGLVGIVSLICFITIAIIYYSVFGSSQIALIVAITLVGFLFWNMKPAKIYLGETGASALGLIFSLLVIEGFQQNYKIGLTLGLTGLIPFFEMLFLITVRTQRGIPFYKGSPDHFALRLFSKGFSVWRIVGYIGLLGLTIMIGTILVLLSDFNMTVLIGIYTFFLCLSLLAYFYLKSIPVEVNSDGN